MKLLKRWPLLIFFCCLLAVGLCYWQLAWHPMKYDATDNFFPIHYFLSECLKAGVWPLWNPFMDLGLPYHADMQTSVHYFPSWIVAYFLPYKMGVFHFEFLLHLAIGGLGMFFFIRFFKVKWEVAVAFGIFYALSGHFLSNAQHQSWIVSTAYLPWVWAFLMRFFQKPNFYYALGLGLTNMLMLTGGYPIFLLLNAYAIAIFLLFYFPLKQWKNFLFWGGFALFVFGLTSFGYFYSIWDVWSALSRSEGLSYEAANMNPFPPQALLGLFNPQIWVRKKEWFDGDSAMTNVYQGLFFTVLIIFSLFAKIKGKQGVFVVLTILFTLLAFGDYFVLRRWTFGFPFMDLFRHIGIFRIFSILFIYPIAALSLQQLIESPQKQQVLKKILLFLIGLYTIYLLSGFLMGKEFLAWHLIVGSTAIQLAFLLLYFGIIYFNRKRKFPYKSLLLLNILNLLILHQFNIPVNVVHKRPLSDFQAVLNEAPKGFQADLYQNKHIATQNNYGKDYTIPIYYNWSVIAKKFSNDQYYPFILKKKAALERQPDYWQIIDAPLLHAPTDSTVETVLLEYHPNYYKFKVLSPESKEVDLRFIQTNFKHWELYLNGKRYFQDPNRNLVEIDTLPLKAGENELILRYYSKKVVWSMAFGLVSSFLAMIFLFILYFRQKKK